MTEILAPSLDNIQRISEVLKSGEIAGIPTETVYGLAADAWNEKAISKIYNAKERPSFDPLIIHLGFQQVSPHQEPLKTMHEKLHLIDLDLIPEANRIWIEFLIKSFWPGPLTFILPKSDHLSSIVTGGLKTVGLRMPAHPITQGLLNQSQLQLAAPSANRFGKISPTRAIDVKKELNGKVKFILNGGQCQKGLESTVIDCTQANQVTILRPGAVSKNILQKTLEPYKSVSVSTAIELSGKNEIQSPGQLSSHYAPRQRCILLEGPLEEVLKQESFEVSFSKLKGQVAVLFAKAPSASLTERLNQYESIEIFYRILSEEGNSDEAAHQLFSHLREIDESSAKIVYMEPWPSSEGLGHAISDRIRRACAPRETF